jgi:hypothetical protein
MALIEPTTGQRRIKNLDPEVSVYAGQKKI